MEEPFRNEKMHLASDNRAYDDTHPFRMRTKLFQRGVVAKRAVGPFVRRKPVLGKRRVPRARGSRDALERRVGEDVDVRQSR